MKAFPVEYRHRVVALTAKGFTSGEIAEVLGASSAWVRSIKALHASGRPLDPKSCANTRRSLAQREGEGESIRARVRAKPGTTLEDLKRDPALDLSVSNLWYALRDLKITLKKKRFARPNRIAPTSLPPARSGGSLRRGSTRAASSSSTRPPAPPP